MFQRLFHQQVYATESAAEGPPGAAAADTAPAVATDSTQSAAAVESAATPEPAGGGPAGGQPSPSQTDWRDRRIAQLTGKLRESQERLQKITTATTAPPPAADPGLTEAEINRRAAMLAQANAFNARCDEIAKQGAATFGEPAFKASVQALTSLIDQTDDQSKTAYAQMLQAVLEQPEPHRAFYELSKDLNEASRVMALDPVKMGVEITRKMLASAPDTAAAAVSRVPKPVTPVGVRTASHEDIRPGDKDRADSLDTATWMARRDAEIARKRTAA